MKAKFSSGFAAIAMLLSTAVLAQDAAPKVTIIHAGTLLAVPGEQPVHEQSIIVDGDRIREIRSGYLEASDVEGEVTIVDLSSNFVMPGFYRLPRALALGWRGLDRKVLFRSKRADPGKICPASDQAGDA